MNGKMKFHPGASPAFNAGEIWFPCDGQKFQVEILGTRRFGDGKFDVEVTYQDDRKIPLEKDAWNFQVRYFHQADKNL